MGYDLIAKNKKSKTQHISIGAFSWPIFLSYTGMGYVIGYGAGINPGTYVYKPQNKTGSPASNDGYEVSSMEAKAMAMCARGFVSVNRFLNKEWDEIEESERERMKITKGYDGKDLYNQGWAEDRLLQIENFAEFAEQSGGFKIK